MRLRDRISRGIRAVFHNLLDRDTHIPEEDRLATDIEVAQARLAQRQEQLVDATARLQEVQTAWQQAHARAAEVQQRLDAAARAGLSIEAESLQAELRQMQVLAQELGEHGARLRQSAAEMQADMRGLQQRIERGRQRLAKLAQAAARASTAANAPPPAFSAPQEPAPTAAMKSSNAELTAAHADDPVGSPATTPPPDLAAVSYTHLRAHETVLALVCRLLLEKKKN